MEELDTNREVFFNEMKKLYQIVHGDMQLKNKYDRGSFFANYKDLVKLCGALIRNHRLDLPYLWSQDENNDKLYVVPKCFEDENQKRVKLLDEVKVNGTSLIYGEVLPTVYAFVLVIVKCLVMIKDIEAIQNNPDYVKSPKGGIDAVICLIHQGISTSLNEVLINDNEEALEQVDINKECNDLINLALLVAVTTPAFKWSMTDCSFIKRILLVEIPPEELIRKDEE